MSRAVPLLLCLWLAGCQNGPPADCRPVSFQELGAFVYKTGQVPAATRALDGQRVELQGYMLPVDFEGHDLRSFLLSKDRNACCFGKMPAMNQWVMVKVEPNCRADVIMDRPIRVCGRIEVGEQCKDGVVVSLYRQQAEYMGELTSRP